jgi:hypothetical protein
MSPLFSEAGAQEADATIVRRVVLRDNDAKKIGNILSFGAGSLTDHCPNAQTIAAEVDAQTYTLLACEDGFTSDQELNFLTADCTGQAYFSGDLTNSLVPRSAVWRHDGQQTLYVDDLSSTTEELKILSATSGDTQTPNDCVPVDAAPFLVRKATPVLDLLTKFTPPFMLD